MSAQLSSKDIQRLKWLLGNVLAILALWSAIALSGSSFIVIVLSMICVSVCVLKPEIPGRWIVPNLQYIVWGVIFFALVDFLFNGVSFLNPLIRLVIFLLLIRACTYRTRREDMQILLLSLFLMVLTGVLTVSLLFGAQMLTFTPIAMIFLFFVNLAEASKDEMLTEEDWKNFSLKRFIGRVIDSMDRTFMALAGVLFVVLVAISGMIFVLIPRFQIDQNIPFLQAQSQPRSGFTENIEFGEVSEIIEDNSVAVRLDAPSREVIPNNPYWRMLVADEYSSGTFKVSSSAMEGRFVDRSTEPRSEYWSNMKGLKNFGEIPLQQGEWTFYMEGNISRYLPHLGPFRRLRFPKEVRMSSSDATYTQWTELVSSSVFSYQMDAMNETREWLPHPIEESVLPASSPIIESPDSDVMKAVEFPMTQLAVSLFPVDVEILQRFIQEIRADRDLTAREFAAEVVLWLEKRHRYSLSPSIDTSVGDPVVRWMESQGGGHCELFAAGMTLLCRANGIPARVVVGFNGGSWNPVEEYFIIRNRNAHAWVEIFDGEYWVRYDPTPSSELITRLAENGQVSVIQEEKGWTAWVDSLRIVWYRQIVNFDQASQEALVKVFAESLRENVTAFVDNVRGFLISVRDYWLRVLEENTWWRPLIAVIAFILIAFILLRRRAQWIWQMQKMRTWMRGEGDVYEPLRRQASKWIDRLRGLENAGSEAGDLQLRLEAIRYGPRPDELDPFGEFQKAKALLKRR
ncbi:MAG: transglutaminaseTgpA domain-containing protein [Opitutales bacterium]